jgi:hypothetical protein
LLESLNRIVGDMTSVRAGKPLLASQLRVEASWSSRQRAVT